MNLKMLSRIKQRILASPYFIKFAKNSGWMMGDQFFTLIISLVIGILTARYLGPSQYGLINYGQSLIAIFVPICALGLDGIIVRDLVTFPEKTGEIIGTGITLRLAAAVGSLLIIPIYLVIMERGNSLLMIVTMAQSLSLAFQSLQLISARFQARLESRYVTVSRIIVETVMTVWKIALLVSKASLVYFAFTTSIDAALTGLALLFMFWKTTPQRLTFNWARGKNLLFQGWHLIISGLMVTIYLRIDQIMIGKMLGSTQLGIYSVAVTIASQWYFIPNAMINSAMSVIMGSYNTNRAKFEKQLKALYCTVIWMGVAVGVVISLFGYPLIKLLFGAAYARSAYPLKINIWSGIFAMLGTARNIWIICEHKQKYVKNYIFVGCITNILLNVLLIPRIGIDGAALATLVTQITSAILAPMIWKETRESSFLMLKSVFMWKHLERKCPK